MNIELSYLKPASHCGGADKRGVDEGDAVEVRFVPEFEGRGLLGVHALCVDRR